MYLIYHIINIKNICNFFNYVNVYPHLKTYVKIQMSLFFFSWVLKKESKINIKAGIHSS